MKPIPYILIKCAMTLDGYIDDASDKRLIVSNEKDFAEVEKVRESCDAIFVGAETIRKDNPRLILKSGKKLTKVTITSSGNLDPQNNFFTMGESEKIVYTTAEKAEILKQKIPNATTVPCHPDLNSESQNLRFILEDLSQRGIKRLLVEGGSSIITQFLKAGFVDELQTSIAPLILGKKGATRLVNGEVLKTTINLQLESIEKLDDMIVLKYTKEQLNNETMKRWIEYVIALSKNCPPSDTAFAVGAVLIDEQEKIVADGYSRELDERMHAEEVVFEKIKNKNLDLSHTILYTSLEPCNKRLSKTESCVDLILKHGINKIVYATTEPLFFADANGAKRLKEAGKEVINLPEFTNEVITIQSPSIQEKWENDPSTI